MIIPMVGIGTLRYLLALIVLFLHADFVTFEAAQIAVLTFFFISGFLMERTIGRYSSPVPFIANRILRLLPTFIAVAASTYLIVRLATEEFRQAFAYIYLRPLIGYGPENPAPLRAALTLEWDLNIPYLGFESELVPQAWSIGNEMIYYLTVPLLALMSKRIVIAVVAGSGIFLSIQLLTRWQDFDYQIYTNLLATYFFFGAGFLSSLVGLGNLRLSRKVSVRLRVFALLTAIAVFWVDLPDTLSPFFVILIVSLLCSMIVAGFLADARANESEISRFLGKLSYPLYLSHMIAIGLLNFLTILSPLVLILSATALALALQILIERPIEILRDKVRR